MKRQGKGVRMINVTRLPQEQGKQTSKFRNCISVLLYQDSFSFRVNQAIKLRGKRRSTVLESASSPYWGC